MAPLNKLVKQINKENNGLKAPWFDPDDGGVNAKVLFLLEAPGSKADASKGSGLVSADNNDATACNCFELREAAGLPRSATVQWNIVPWYLPDIDGKTTRSTTSEDVKEALPWLKSIVGEMKELRLVVTMGVHAAAGWNQWMLEDEEAPLIRCLQVPHPSARNLNTRPHFRAQLEMAYRRAASVARA